nr:coproporphyrinogen-iii oxidase 2, chloroplastic [Quercus suber]
MIREALDSVCKAIEGANGGAKFKDDVWSRPGGGGGISRVLQDSVVWEKAGVNISVVYGVMPPKAYRAATAIAELKLGPVPFFAARISFVNPVVVGVSIKKEIPETERPNTFLHESDDHDSPSSSSSTVRSCFKKMIREALDSVCKAIEGANGGAKFKDDVWSRPGGGRGISRVLQDSVVWEKAGVNIFVVYGVMPLKAYRAATAIAELKLGPVPFFVARISFVNPVVVGDVVDLCRCGQAVLEEAVDHEGVGFWVEGVKLGGDVGLRADDMELRLCCLVELVVQVGVGFGRVGGGGKRLGILDSEVNHVMVHYGMEIQ